MYHLANLMMALSNRLAERQAPPGHEIPPGDPTIGVAENVRTIIGVSVFSIVLATGSVMARFLFRKTSKLRWMADDYTIVIAALVSNANAASYLWAIQFGFGQHIYVLEPEQLIAFFKIVFVTFIFYGAAVTFVKFSVLLFYNRIFPHNNFKRWLIALGVASAIWWILITLVSVLQCIPVQKAWDAELPGQCIPYLELFIAIQVLNIILDVAILILPISAVAKLQMKRANKISVAGTFALGGLSVIFAIVRLAILVLDMQQTDITFATPTANWSLVEPAFEIFCACLPCMTPVLKAGRVLSKVGSSLRFSSKRSSEGSSGTATINLSQPVGHSKHSYPDSQGSQTRSLNRDHHFEMLDDKDLPVTPYHHLGSTRDF